MTELEQLRQVVSDAEFESSHGHWQACTAILRSASPAAAAGTSGSGVDQRIPVASLVASLGGGFHAENLVLQALEELAGGSLIDVFNAEDLLSLSVTPVHAEWVRKHLGEKP